MGRTFYGSSKGMMRFPRHRLLGGLNQRRIWVRVGATLTVIFVCTFAIVFVLSGPDESQLRLERLLKQIQTWKSKKSFPDLEGCQLPFIDPFDRVILNDWFRKDKKCTCNRDKRFIFSPKQSGNVTCFELDEEALARDYEATANDLNCQFKLIRSNLTKKVWLNNYEYYDQKLFTLDTCTDEELIWISCKIKHHTYEQPAFNLGSLKTVENKNEKQKWNVLVLGIDALSRMAFHRTMTRSWKTISHMYGRNMIELTAFNKVGMNSAPNQIPFLTGKRFRHETDMNRGQYFDDFGKFIWEDFKKAGFDTYFSEEQPQYGLFNYPNRSGFREIPTDFWPRPTMLAAEALRKSKNPDCYYCLGGKFLTEHVMNYWITLQSLNKNPLFSYLWHSETTHDDLAGALDVDDIIANFFLTLDQQGIINNTIILFLADHGYRVGPFRNSPLGAAEDMLPFGFVLLPKSFTEAFPDDLRRAKINGDRLVTPYDIHATLQDLAFRFREDGVQPDSAPSQASFSLFSSEIPKNRTCMDAAIDPEYCACFVTDDLKVNVSAVEADSLALQTVDAVNSYLEQNDLLSKCSTVSNGIIEHSTVLSAKDGRSSYLKATVKVQPSPMSFETFFQISNDSNAKTLVGIPERLDRYDKYARCVENTAFMKMCYCR